MASHTHQRILSLIVKKMIHEGYEIVAFDGDYTTLEKIPVNIPFKVLRHRPDVIGITRDMSKLCIGEAKTSSDLRSTRTKEEFIDFALIGDHVYKEVNLIIGAPLSSKKVLFKVIENLNLSSNKNIQYLFVPEALLSNV
ncbi:hypothetical protein [Methanolobus chelungpuianus]|uniref:Uncharacterized protein n=1 Tax=Methanolobus chelungpuianus TaxID=502115 RepID=A0AAE3KWS7_9EURY|nr:hypothetical protein [Methanolobus chelungpuianus]MCQ6962436.1 hypothetical protein [Methanolobus chelungpuianus]